MGSQLTGKPVKILLVEDNPGDVRLTQEALKDAKVLNRLSVVGDGEQAMDYLRRENGFEESERPDLILLDLNLPKKDGREVLAEIKGDEALRRIPVVMLTTSAAEIDIIQSYDLHAEIDIIQSYDLHVNCYITKPVDLEQFIKIVKAIQEFSLTIVQLPQD